MVKLLLPLHCYDAAGHIRPPVVLWWVLAFMAKSYLIFLAALTTGELAEYTLSMIYPRKQDLYQGFATGTLSLLVFSLVSFREKIWKRGQHRIYGFLRVLIILGLAADLLLCAWILKAQQGAFSWGIATRILGGGFALWWVVASQHLSLMCQDWQRPS